MDNIENPAVRAAFWLVLRAHENRAFQFGAKTSKAKEHMAEHCGEHPLAFAPLHKWEWLCFDLEHGRFWTLYWYKNGRVEGERLLTVDLAFEKILETYIKQPFTKQQISFFEQAQEIEAERAEFKVEIAYPAPTKKDVEALKRDSLAAAEQMQPLFVSLENKIERSKKDDYLFHKRLKESARWVMPADELGLRLNVLAMATRGAHIELEAHTAKARIQPSETGPCFEFDLAGNNETLSAQLSYYLGCRYIERRFPELEIRLLEEGKEFTVIARLRENYPVSLELLRLGRISPQEEPQNILRVRNGEVDVEQSESPKPITVALSEAMRNITGFITSRCNAAHL